MKIKFTKQRLRELKSAQAVVAKKAKSPDFWKTVPKAAAEASRMKI